MTSQDSSKPSKQTVNVPGELVHPTRVKMAKADIRSYQALFVGLLRGWLSGEVAPAAPPAPSLPAAFPPKHRQAHELLEEILSEGTAKDADWITGNLLNFVEAIRSRKDKRGHRRAS